MTDKEIIIPEGLDVDKASEVLGEYARTDDAQIVDQSELDALEDAKDDLEDEVEALEANLSEIEAPLRAALQERTGLSEAAVSDLSYEALTDEFRNDEGDIDVDALAQNPETGEPANEPDNQTEEAEALASDLGFDSRDEAVEVLETRYENYKNAGWESNAQSVKSDLDALGVEV